MKKNKLLESVYIDGNSGANYVQITKLDNNRMRLEIGDCCVITIDVIFTAEVFSNFLTELTLGANKNLLEIAKEYLAWDDTTNKEFLKGCK